MYDSLDASNFVIGTSQTIRYVKNIFNLYSVYVFENYREIVFRIRTQILLGKCI